MAKKEKVKRVLVERYYYRTVQRKLDSGLTWGQIDLGSTVFCNFIEWYLTHYVNGCWKRSVQRYKYQMVIGPSKGLNRETILEKIFLRYIANTSVQRVPYERYINWKDKTLLETFDRYKTSLEMGIDLTMEGALNI